MVLKTISPGCGVRASLVLFIALIHPIQYTIALPVGTTGPANARKRHPVYTTSRTGHGVWILSVAHRTSFLCRHRDVIASFSFGAWSVQTCFVQRDVFAVLQRIQPFIELFILHISTEVLTIMSSPGQKKRGTCGHIMAVFDGHLKCARCRDNGVRDDPCVLKKDCPICKAFTPEQIQQLATPTYRDRKIKTRRFLPPLPPLSWTLHKSVCWDG